MLDQVKYIVAVASGKGGVGKSTTAVNLALAMQAAGKKVGLLDADIYGPSIAMMLGVADGTRPKAADEKHFAPIEAHGLATMSMAYLVTVAVSGHACLARLLADTGGVWEATATKLRFFLATIGVFVRQEPSPRTPGRV